MKTIYRYIVPYAVTVNFFRYILIKSIQIDILIARAPSFLNYTALNPPVLHPSFKHLRYKGILAAYDKRKYNNRHFGMLFAVNISAIAALMRIVPGAQRI